VNRDSKADTTPDYDDPDVEEQWCAERRGDVVDYLDAEGVAHGRVGEGPAWHVAPYVSVWAIESKERPDSVGWWVICGDLPTDYVSADEITHPREAIRTFGTRWREQAQFMATGERPDDIYIGGPEDWPSLAPLLEARATLLLTFADDDSIWEDV
jgi:hypothetical protein